MGGEIPAEAGEGRGAPGGGGPGAHHHPPDCRPAAHAVLRPARHGEDHHRARHLLSALRSRALQVKSSRTQRYGYPCPPYKIIILDEADSMTEDAQNALRRTMETYTKVTRFFFICNYISRIIEPLASRCAKFRFKPLSEDVMSNRILHICNVEGLSVDAQALYTLSAISQGDLRRAITYLQSAARLYGSSISSTDLISVSGAIPEDAVKSLLAACKSGEFDVANKEVSNIIADGYPVSQLISQFLDVIVNADDIPDEQKCLVDGADEYLQLLDVASETIRAPFNMPQGFVF